MEINNFSRQEIRKRNPDLKIANNQKLDFAIHDVFKTVWAGAYLGGSKDFEKLEKDFNETLSSLDNSAQLALLDFYRSLTTMLEERIEK